MCEFTVDILLKLLNEVKLSIELKLAMDKSLLDADDELPLLPADWKFLSPPDDTIRE